MPPRTKIDQRLARIRDIWFPMKLALLVEDVAGAVKDLIMEEGRAFRLVRTWCANHPTRPCGPADHLVRTRHRSIDVAASGAADEPFAELG
jgi:hypothetical protein